MPRSVSSLSALAGPIFATPRVYERAYAGQDATGADRPTMNFFNPQWAHWFDAVKDAAGGNQVNFGARGSSLMKLPTSNLHAPEPPAGDGNWRSLESPWRSLEGLR
jgi:hypothetical protein